MATFAERKSEDKSRNQHPSIDEFSGEVFKSNLGFVRASTLIMRFALAAEFVVVVIFHLVSGLYLITFPTYLSWTSGFNIAFGIFTAVIVAYLGFYHAEHRFSAFVVILLGCWTIYENLWAPFLNRNGIFLEWSNLGIVFYIYVGVIGIGVIWSIVHIILISVARSRQVQREFAPKTARRRSEVTTQVFLHSMTTSLRKHKAMHLVCIGLVVGSGLVVLGFLNNSFWVGQTVQITPGSRQIEIALFTRLDYNFYTPDQLASMNNHSLLIITHDTPAFVSTEQWNADPFHWMDNITTTAAYINGRAAFVSLCSYWRDHYPNVHIMPAVLGIPCGYPIDLSMTNGSHGVGGTIWQAKQYLLTAVEYNLTNVVGLHADQESCQSVWNVQSQWRNRTRNHEANANWISYFQWVNASYARPDWITYFNNTGNRTTFYFQTTFGYDSCVDGLDGDDDLDVAVRNNVLQVPYWEDYAPMFYKSGYSMLDPAHYKLYLDLQMLNGSLSRYGLQHLIGTYLGITGEGIFRASSTFTQLNGKSQQSVTGFDNLVRQALIVKSFGARRVSIFLGTTVENMIGAFDEYGDDFLDRFNASVNGPAAQTPFDILYLPNASELDKEPVRDFILTGSYGFAVIYAIMLGCCVFAAFASDIKYRRIICGKIIRHHPFFS
nr:hypothetical protein [Candidatus Sigynarchaeota archaeon]